MALALKKVNPDFRFKVSLGHAVGLRFRVGVAVRVRAVGAEVECGLP